MSRTFERQSKKMKPSTLFSSLIILVCSTACDKESNSLCSEGPLTEELTRVTISGGVDYPAFRSDGERFLPGQELLFMSDLEWSCSNSTGPELRINGSVVDLFDPVSLPVGTHDIAYSMDGCEWNVIGRTCPRTSGRLDVEFSIEVLDTAGVEDFGDML